MLRIIATLFLTGLLFGSGPCMVSCGPVLVSYIAGTKKNIPKAFLTYVLFSSSRIFVYLILGVLIYLLGNFTVEQVLGKFSRYILILGGCFIIVIGLLMVLGRRFEFKACKFLNRNILEQDKKSIMAMGLLIGLLPCAPLLAILSYIGLVSKSWPQSLLYSFSFGIGTFTSALLLIAVFAGMLPKFLVGRKENLAKIFSIICGLIIIFFGIQLMMGAF